MSHLHRVHENRSSFGQDLLSSTAVRADVLARQYGYTGQGVTVAFIDSGFTQYSHPDLDDSRILGFVDFVNRVPRLRADENGHGTHVTGIVAGTGQPGAKYAGIAPGVSILSLKVLDEDGKGSIGDIIAAMDWVATNRTRYNIKVVNMSVGAGVYESVLDRPSDVSGQGPGRSGRDCRSGGWEFWEECGGRNAVGWDYGPGRRALGSDGMRFQHRRHTRQS